jgi:hypothetical protein
VSSEQPGLIASDEGASETAGEPGDDDAGLSTTADRSTFTLAAPSTNGDVADAVDLDDDQPRPNAPKQLTRRERRQLGRLRARKVSRVVRRIDPWSVLLISLGFYLCLFAVLMVAGLLLWAIASVTGTVHQIEGTVKDLFAEKSFHFDGLKIFRASFLGGLILVIAGSGLNVLLCTLFNLISDLVGGIRVTVIEEETARPPR